MPNIARNIKKPGTPLGGIGAERQDHRVHSLVLDDRLLSKQYITGRVDSKVSDVAYGGTWADVTDIAPSKGAIQAYLASLTVNPSHWTQDGSGGTAKSRTVDTGYVGIGSGSTLDYDDITERLTVDGNIKTTGTLSATGSITSAASLQVAGGIEITNDGEALEFGQDDDVSLTHVHNTGLQLNSTNKLMFNDASQFIQGSSATVLSIGATDEIDLTATTIDINGAADVSGNLTVGGNLTVSGTATATYSETVNIQDNMIVLNSNATGSASEDAGIEIERGDDANRKLFWDESEDAWMIETGTGVYTEIAGGGGTLTGTNTGDVTITLASGVPVGAFTINAQTVTFANAFIYNTGTTNAIGVDGGADGKLSLFGTEGGSGTGTSGLVVKGGNSASGAPAVAITGALEADTKSFNIPHPLDSNKRLVYGCLEGPEYGMYQRGSFLVDDERRIVAIDLPNYWFKMVYEDYAINITTYGDYNVWINNRDENGFWVETNAEGEWSFDWSVIGGRRDAKLVVEPDA
jgi:phage baseplate assembly protein gpV